jgi:hypothetical protein
MKESFESTGKPEIDHLLLVLQEILEEQQQTNKMNTDLVAAVNRLTTKVSGFQEKLENQKIIVPAADPQPLQEVIRKGVMDIKLMVGAQPKNIIQKFQVLLFPEQDAKLFYKVVFGRWFLWLAIMVLLTNLYKWSVHWSDGQKEVEIQQIENDKTRQAWNYLYEQKSKDLHRRMDSALERIKSEIK